MGCRCARCVRSTLCSRPLCNRLPCRRRKSKRKRRPKAKAKAEIAELEEGSNPTYEGYIREIRGSREDLVPEPISSDDKKAYYREGRTSREELLLEPLSSGERKALAIEDGIAGGAGAEVVVSFPGKHQDEWNEIVSIVSLLKVLNAMVKPAEEAHVFSTVCVFMPTGDPLEGSHCRNDIDDVESCFCDKLYGSQQEWGCAWFAAWRKQLQRALDRGQVPVVIYKEREVGQNDWRSWNELPVTHSLRQAGLGGSQVGEVAFLRRLVGDDFQKRDAIELSADILVRTLAELRKVVPKGHKGGRLLAEAIRQCPEAQQGLQSLSLGGCELGVGGMAAVAEVLPRLTSLQRLFLAHNGLGETGTAQLTGALRELPALRLLDLSYNGLGEAGAAQLATALRELQSLRELNLAGNNLRESGIVQLSAALRELGSLRELVLSHNGLKEAGARQLGLALRHLPALQWLDLSENGLSHTGPGMIAVRSALPAGCDVCWP